MSYTIEVDILGEKYNGKGKTLDDALASIDLSWEQIKGKGTMNIVNGKRKHTHLFGMNVLRRIFSNKIARMHWSRNLEYFLKEEVTTNIPK